MLVPLYPLVVGQLSVTGIVMVIFCLVVSGFLLWLLYGTGYIIDNSYITYYSGPVKGKIEIEKIHTVISGKSLYIGLKPATALNGIIVKYGKYDEIYFSPENNEIFIAQLLKIKPGIKVVKAGKI